MTREKNRPSSTVHRLIDTSRIRDKLCYQDVVSYPDAVQATASHYAQHPLPRSGPDELKINDPFDYAAEDAFEQALPEFEKSTRNRLPRGQFVHQYDHPKVR